MGTKPGMTVLQLLGSHPNKLGGFEDYILAFATKIHEMDYRTVFTFEGEPRSYIKKNQERSIVSIPFMKNQKAWSVM